VVRFTAFQERWGTVERQWQPRWPILITRKEMLASLQKAVDAVGGAEQVARLRKALDEEDETSMVLQENSRPCTGFQTQQYLSCLDPSICTEKTQPTSRWTGL
jgi:hypothetical protein